jgi:hypothetical protein
MTGGAWGTAFADKGADVYRIKYVQPTSFATFIPILEKSREGGSATVGEDNDVDKYILGIVTKVADINVKPLFVWVDSNSAATTDTDILVFNLALDGAFGNIGWEAEFAVNDYDLETGTDYTVWGAYANVWGNLDALKIGALFAYGSYDDDAAKGFDFGDDFEAGGALIMGDDILFGAAGSGNSNNDLTAGTLFAVYADYAVNDKLSLGAYFGYATCNFDDNSKWDGADVYEISADVTYKITDNLTYKVAAGTAQLEYGDSTEDPDRAVEVYHKLSFSF